MAPVRVTLAFEGTSTTVEVAYGQTIWHVMALIKAERGIPRREMQVVDGEQQVVHPTTVIDATLLDLKLVRVTPMCSVCGATDSDLQLHDVRLKYCSCHGVLYCSTECQAHDWLSHKPQCRSLRRVIEAPIPRR